MCGRQLLGVCFGSFLALVALMACSSDDSASGYDAGDLPDVLVPTRDAGHDAATSSSRDAGSDAASDDATVGSDDGSSPGPGDATTVDASGASTAPDAADGGAKDAAGQADASDAAGDAAPGDASTDASTDDDASSDDASPAPDGGTDDDASIEASTVSFCATYDAGTNPIVAVVTTDNGQTVDQLGTGSAAASASYPVVLAITTSPANLAQGVQVGYCTGSKTCASATFVPATPAADAGVAGDSWTAQIPALTPGTNVFWWVQAGDTCTTGEQHYWSNYGNDFEYTTE